MGIFKGRWNTEEVILKRQEQSCLRWVVAGKWIFQLFWLHTTNLRCKVSTVTEQAL